VTDPDPPVILLIGADEALIYLMDRYAQRSGYRVHVADAPLPDARLRELRPVVVWFPSLESLEAMGPREGGLLSDDAPLIVSSSVADEARARELGADYCALHPLTFRDFLAALSAVGAGGDHSRRSTPA
jgi:DNA-binding response OmpR family regulator